MRNELTRLLRKLSELNYQVQSYGDLGAERELEQVRQEIRKLYSKTNQVAIA